MKEGDGGSTAYAVPLTGLARPAVGGRALWGFDTLHDALPHIAGDAIGCQYEPADLAAARASLAQPYLDLRLGLGKVGQDYLA